METEPIELKPSDSEPSLPPKPKRTWIKYLIITILTLVLVAGGIGYYLYQRAFGNNLIAAQQDRILTIPIGTESLEQVANILAEEQIITNKSDFIWTAQQKSYKVKAGKYKLPASARSNNDLVNILRGNQLTIQLTFHNIRTKEQLAGALSHQISSDSASILTFFNDANALGKDSFAPQTVMAAFIPNTYQIYWNYDIQQLWERILKEHKGFWAKENRLEKAKKLNLTPTQVYTLASIVETETQYNPEKPRIAGVYLNRLRQHWKLEADPTVVFAHQDFEIRRVLQRHLDIDSPYNTYRYEGLPPGPIYMASIASIDAVLNYETHDYMFFCAKPDLSGSHAFAATLSAHNANARAYHQWLNQRGN